MNKEKQEFYGRMATELANYVNNRAPKSDIYKVIADPDAWGVEVVSLTGEAIYSVEDVMRFAAFHNLSCYVWINHDGLPAIRLQ